MPLSVTCPGCDSNYPVSDSLIGKKIRCKQCGEVISVSASSAQPQPIKRAVRIDDDDPAPARPVKKAARVLDDEEMPVKRKASRAIVDDDEDDDDDDMPRKKGAAKKGMSVGLLVGIAVGVLVLGGAGVAAVLMLSGSSDNDVALNDTPPITPAMNTPMPVTPPATTNTGTADAGNGNSAPVPVKPQETKSEPVTPTQPVQKQEIPQIQPRVTPPAVAQQPPLTPTGINPRDYMFGQMSRITIDHVKQASVLIRTETDTGVGEGSGWFGLEPGFVFTNAHVLSMKAPGSKEPKKLTLYLNAGTNDQREIPHHRLKILAVDRENDLALIQVIGEKDLPVPLKVKPSSQLLEGQGLNTVGYPFGSRLAGAARSTRKPEVSIRRSIFSAFRRDSFGELKKIQVEGGVYTGNSGGPIVDAEGAVCGVVVSVWLDDLGGGQSQIGFCVPTEYVFGLLAGRVSEVEYEVPYKKGDKVHIPFTMTCIDPLNRLGKVGIAGWVGDVSGKPRNPGLEKPEPLPGDANMQVKNLTVETKEKSSKIAKGELVMPTLAPGRAYWVQPFYGNTSTPEYWMPGIQLPIKGVPVDRTPADLVVRFSPGTKRTLTLSNSSDLTEYIDGEGESKKDRASIKSTLKVTESVFGPDKQDYAARLRLSFDEIDLKADIGGITEEDAMPKQIKNLLNQFVKLAEAVGFVNKFGEMFRYQVNTLAIQDPVGKILVTAFANDALEALQVASIPMPNRTVNAGETWESKKTVRLSVTFEQVSKQGKMERKIREYRYLNTITYTYVGQRERGGKKEAVIKVEGKISQAAGTKEDARGEMKGMAYVELDTGIVFEAELESEFELDSSSDGLEKKVSGINKYSIQRGSAAK